MRMGGMAFLLLMGIFLAGCGGRAMASTPSGATSLGFDTGQVYRIHPNDQLEITVWSQEELSQTVQLEEDGTFSFPLIGEVLARGFTTKEVELLIAQKLADGYLIKPLVTVKLIGKKFSVFGEVERPGSYLFDGSVDLLAAISMAGGFNKFASSKVELIRVFSDGSKQSFRVNVNKVLSGRRETILMHPHDTIYVKRRLL